MNNKEKTREEKRVGQCVGKLTNALSMGWQGKVNCSVSPLLSPVNANLARCLSLCIIYCYLLPVPASLQSIQSSHFLPSVTEGDNVTVYCKASGIPPPTASWIKVGSGQRFNGSELMFTNINRSGAGEYRCEASNECGNASETASIDVQCKFIVN